MATYRRVSAAEKYAELEARGEERPKGKIWHAAADRPAGGRWRDAAKNAARVSAYYARNREKVRARRREDIERERQRNREYMRRKRIEDPVWALEKDIQENARRNRVKRRALYGN